MIAIKDRPINSCSEDLLHRSDLASYLADTIRTHDLSHSFSIGICGKWGCGKTSFINLIMDNIKDDEKIVFIDFNPWSYSNQSDLVREFFTVFSDTISDQNQIIKSAKKALKIAKIGTTLTEPIFGSNAVFKLLKKYVDQLSSQDSSSKSIKEIKTSISDALSKTSYRFVVVLDDIDRLDRNEIAMMMKLVRTLADFPNVVYLIAYDEDIVSKALTNDLYFGKDYLQKLIHMSVDLPALGDGFVPQQLLNCYLDVVGSVDDRATKVITEELVPLVDTVRDLNVLFRRFLVDYATLRSRTDPVDLLALDLIEVKDRDLYNLISDNRVDLCNGTFSGEVPSRFGKLVSTLFPADKMSEGKRICDLSAVDGYF